MRELYQSEIAGAGALTPLLVAMIDAQNKIVGRLEAIENRVDAVEEKQADFASAFPNYDVEGHRRYHQIMIEKIEETRRLRVAILEKTISGLVWAGLVFVGLAAWHYIKSNLERLA